MKRQGTELRFAICINDGGYVDDLKVRTVYQVLPDESAAKSNYLRIVDETDEDYLYPADNFVLIDMPREAEKVFATSTPLAKYKGGAKKARKQTVVKHKVAT